MGILKNCGQALLMLVLELFAVQNSFGVDTPTLPDVDVRIFHTGASVSTTAKTRIDAFESLFIDRHYRTEHTNGEDPQAYLVEHPSVEIVVAGNFEPDSLGNLALTLYWHPSESHGIPAVAPSLDDLRNIAGKVIDFMEQDYIQSQLAENQLAEEQSETDPRIIRATTLYQHGRFREAQDLAGEILKDHEHDEHAYRAHLLLGHLYKRAGDYEGAIAEFRSADGLSGEDDHAKLELGNTFYLMHQYEPAIRKYKDVIAHAGKNETKARANLVLALIGLGLPEQARQEFDKIPEGALYEFSGTDLSGLLGAAEFKQQHRDELFSYAWRSLAGVAVLVVVAMIFLLYRRAQRDPDLTAAQRLDFAGKLIGGLFSMLSLVGGTMLGLLIAS